MSTVDRSSLEGLPARLVSCARSLRMQGSRLSRVRRNEIIDTLAEAAAALSSALSRSVSEEQKEKDHGSPGTPGLEEPQAMRLQPQPANAANAQESLLHPAHQVYFRAGLIACREYMARFVEAESPTIAMSIRANWWPSLGEDFGPPRQLHWNEVTVGEYGTLEFRVKTAEEVSPTQEALPIALGFLQRPFGEALSAPNVVAEDLPGKSGVSDV